MNGYPNRLLRAVYEGLKEQFRYLFQACYDLGYHPRPFKEANTIILKKLQKPDYSEPKTYRLITLLDTLRKALEAVISIRIREYAEANRLLLEEQIGARKGRSVETVLELITDAVYIVWSIGGANIASLLLLDITRAFDNILYKRLLYNLKVKGIPIRII